LGFGWHGQLQKNRRIRDCAPKSRGEGWPAKPWRSRPVYYVYLIESVSSPNRHYVGFTENLRQRLFDHNEGKLPTTAPHRPWRLVTYLAFSSKKQALNFEKYLKSGSGHAFAKKRLW
jgi:predicted GIY-YIG superfamily endonuclease